MARRAASLVALSLPLPPSVNKAFASRRGSHLTMKTETYRFWERQVRDENGNGGLLPYLAPGDYGLWLDLPPAMRGDIDNRVKLVSDILKLPGKTSPSGLGVVVDDGFMKGLYVGFSDGLKPGRCAVTVVSMAVWCGYVCMRMEP